MFNELKEKIKEASDFVETLPEKHKDKVFDLLLQVLEKDYLSKVQPSPQRPPQNQLNSEFTADQPKPNEPSGAPGGFVIPAKVRAFLTRSKLNEENVRKLVMVEGTEVHFISEPTTDKIVTGQIHWSLLLAMKSAILGGEFEVDAESVRSICIEKGLYDRANFASNFKKNAGLYQSVPEGQGEAVKLSKDGEKELGDLIRELAS